MVIIKCNL